jgi:uncharacterized membrane protein
MKRTYDEFAGQSVERLAALSDGLFGVAMTLLLLDLHIPEKQRVQNEADLLRALRSILPDLLVYLMSFMSLGIFWVGQQTQLNHLSRSDRHLTWLHMAFLFAVTLMPFSTRLLIDFITYRTALLVYWANFVFLGGLLYACWRRANSAGLVKSDIPAGLADAVCLRIVYAQRLYALGAVLCIVNTYCSIGFIVLVQLNYVIAPRFGRRKG